MRGGAEAPAACCWTVCATSWASSRRPSAVAGRNCPGAKKMSWPIVTARAASRSATAAASPSVWTRTPGGTAASDAVRSDRAAAPAAGWSACRSKRSPGWTLRGSPFGGAEVSSRSSDALPRRDGGVGQSVPGMGLIAQRLPFRARRMLRRRFRERVTGRGAGSDCPSERPFEGLKMLSDVRRWQLHVGAATDASWACLSIWRTAPPAMRAGCAPAEPFRGRDLDGETRPRSSPFETPFTLEPFR